MQENKYYTPSLEEFHVGFEYEIYETITNGIEPDLKKYKKYSDEYFEEVHTNDKYWLHRKWISKVVSKETVYWFPQYIFEQQYTPNNIKNIIRVKHLTKEDIESLGFKPDYDRAWGKRICFENDYCALTYQEENNILQVVTREDYIYKGLIKNKSELQKLMKQLNINIKEEV